MSAALLCDHCSLPVGRSAHEREVAGNALRFCCYGCCLAYQVAHGDRDEPEAAWLLIRLGVGAFLAMFIMTFSLLLYSGTFGAADGYLVVIVHYVLWALATPLLVILGGPFIRGAWQDAQQARVTADTLISIGVIAAYAYSALEVLRGGENVYFDTVTMILVLFTLGRYLEAQGRVRTARSLAPMLAAERASAIVVDKGGDSEQCVRDIPAGAIVRVRPGERIAVDGVVVEGYSQCDEAVLTGQPEPCPKQPGASVYAGSVNGMGQLLVRASVAGNATRWVRISHCVREALSRKSLIGEIVDRMAAIFVPAVLLLAVVTTWYWTGHASLEQALMTGLAVLVVACPCSLGLAAPLASALGLNSAAQMGVLVRGGGVLERLARVKAVAFDKTGTLTKGKPQLVSVTTKGANQDEVLSRAAALARGSEHPIARSIASHAHTVEYAAEIQAYPGAGVSGIVGGNMTVMGSASFMASLGWTVPRSFAERAVTAATQVYVGWDGSAKGLLSFADAPLPAARAVIDELTHTGIATCMLSGDTSAAAGRVANAVGIRDWHAGLTPEDKVAALRDWQRVHGTVAMVGDGLNDGPVLAAATVGIAVGGATDLARESADVTLPENALHRLPELLNLARRVRKSIVANLVWALGYNVVALTLAVMGWLQPIIAAALMAGSSLLVVIRSLRANQRARGRLSEHAEPTAIIDHSTGVRRAA
jgi:Cu2+-exporting ATPase